MKIKKKIVIPVVAAAVIGISVFAVPRIVNGAGSKATQVSAAPLSRMDLENTVSVTGTVKSEDVTNVYSTLAYQVKDVNVEVGDIVYEGDVLCVLDTEALSAKIDQQSATLSNSQAKAQHSLNVAQNNLATEKYNQENNYDAQLISAEKTVQQAEQGLEAKESALKAKENALENARILLTSAEQKQKSNNKALRDYKDSYGTPKYSEYDAEYDKLYQAVVQGELSITQAENAVVDAEAAVEDAKKAIEDAKKDISDAKASRNAVKAQKHDTLVTNEQQVQSARINANLSDVEMQIDELRKDIDNAIIKAPVSGTVTAVLATEGGNGQGLLFVIENTGKLKITTKIEEYDVPYVRIGQAAKIKSDGTGDNEYEGKVTKIAPTALKAVNGETQETTDVQFATEIEIVSVGELKIGMNARIDIVTERKPEVFAVSYDAVVEDENGESMVFVARPRTIVNAEKGEGTMPPVSMSAEEYSQLQNEGGEGQKQIDAAREAQQTKAAANGGEGMTAVAVPVKTGMETDFYIEIISDSLREGDLIISNPADLTDGQEIVLEGGVMGTQGAAGGRGPGGRGAAVRVGG